MLIFHVCCTARTSLLHAAILFWHGQSVASTLHGRTFFIALLILEVDTFYPITLEP